MDEVHGGLGLIMLMDSGLPLPDRINHLLPLAAVSQQKDTVETSLPWSREKATLSVAPFLFTSDPSIHSIFHDREGHVLTGFVFSGTGKVGYQLLTATNRIALEGQGQDYAGLWVPLLDVVGREELRPFQVSITSTFPLYPDEPVNVDVVSAGEKPILSMDGILVPLIEDLNIDDLWHSSIVTSSGWHTLNTQDSTNQKFFVSNPGNWNSLRIENQRQLNMSRGPSVESVGKAVQQHEPISPITFLMLFIMSSGFLWLAPKI